MENALAMLIGETPPAEVSHTERACSFCDRQEPEVMLGAGPNDVFICDDCVGLFTEMFQMQRSRPSKEAE
jgi:hypothetical protein